MLRRLVPVWLCLIAGTVLADDVTLPPIDARSYYLIDATTGVELAESRPNEPLDPASLTKLMTAYLAFGALASGEVTLDDSVLVSEKAWREPGSRTFIEVGSEVAFSDLVRGLIIQSGNDAAIAIAEHLAGTEEAFVARMNATAAALGMTGTSYRNPNGLPAAGHLSTTRDSAILARRMIAEFPQYYSFYSEREFTYNSIRQHNRNALLWKDDSVDGLKTGYTSAAGYCLVSSAERDGMRLIAVVFGSTTADKRTDSSMALLDYGFRAFETRRLYSRGEVLAEARVYKGDLEVLSLGLAEDVVLTLPRGEYPKLVASAVLSENLVAPLARDEVVGEFGISLGDREISRLPLVALDAVGQGWLLSRLADDLALWFD